MRKIEKKRYFEKNEVERMLKELKNDLELNKKELFQKLKKLQKSELKQLGQFCHGSVGLVFNVIKSFCKALFDAGSANSNSKSEYIVFPFASKAVYSLNINSIVKDTRISSLLPDSFQSFCPLKVYIAMIFLWEGNSSTMVVF